MTKSQFCVTQMYLPRIISNTTNNKNELWKTVRLTSFQKTTIEICFNLFQVCPSMPSITFALLLNFIHSYNVFSSLILLSFSQFGASSHHLNFDKFHDTTWDAGSVGYAQFYSIVMRTVTLHTIHVAAQENYTKSRNITKFFREL